MKIVASGLILSGGIVQAGGVFFATLHRQTASPTSWSTLAFVLLLGVLLLTMGLACLRLASLPRHGH
ncbi:MAG: hypothetical protein KDA42_02550 [Planctomycetales bacterium]|nr:hypothetical protein [Planctomycetales bacterium]